MALDTYANLKLELASWTDRADLDVTSGGLDTYIDLAESWFNRNLRVRQMVTVNNALTVSAAGVITHPTDWLEWRRVSILTTPIQNLDIVNGRAALLSDNTNASGFPQKVVVQGSGSFVWPAPNGTYTYQGIYYGSVPALSSGNTTNWLLTAYPDAYLFGALIMGFGRIKSSDQMPVWQSAFAQVIGEIQASETEFGDAIGSPVIRNAV
jgi:hypothetical protein